MLELVKKFSSMLSLVHLENLSASRLTSILKMMGYEKLDNEIISLVLEMLSNAAEDFGVKTIGDIVKHPELLEQIGGLIELYQKNAEDSTSERKAAVTLHKDSLLKCSHCGSQNHLASMLALTNYEGD